MSGKFITIEGSEGAGKSSAIAEIQRFLSEQGIEAIYTREPGGCELSEKIRDLLLSNQYADMSEMTELLLMFAARAQHLHEVIAPALAGGYWVVCDRFTDATYAYQCGARGLAEDYVAQLEQLVQGPLRPDITILLDVPADIGLERAKKVGEPDRFESEKIAFFEAVRNAYLTRAEKFPERFRVVDASETEQEVQEEIVRVLAEIVHA